MDTESTLIPDQAKPTATRPAVAAGLCIEAAAPECFSTHSISQLRHTYHEHPLLQLDALADLALQLVPHGLTRFLRPGTTQTSEFSHEATSADGRSVQEVFGQIEEPGSWVALYNVETIAVYRELLEEIVRKASPLYANQQHDLFKIDGFIFISAPPSVTPFHIDRENNFWLQLRGRKLMSVWDCNDREVVRAEHVERFVVNRNLDAVRLRPEHRARALDFDVGPGDGVYFPSTSPHMTSCDRSWVSAGNAVSVSMGVVFHSRETRRAAQVHCVNELLRRRLGLSPAYPGQSRWGDAWKQAAGGALTALRETRGHPPVPGLK